MTYLSTQLGAQWVNEAAAFLRKMQITCEGNAVNQRARGLQTGNKDR